MAIPTTGYVMGNTYVPMIATHLYGGLFGGDAPKVTNNYIYANQTGNTTTSWEELESHSDGPGIVHLVGIDPDETSYHAYMRINIDGTEVYSQLIYYAGGTGNHLVGQPFVGQLGCGCLFYRSSFSIDGRRASSSQVYKYRYQYQTLDWTV